MCNQFEAESVSLSFDHLLEGQLSEELKIQMFCYLLERDKQKRESKMNTNVKEMSKF